MMTLIPVSFWRRALMLVMLWVMWPTALPAAPLAPTASSMVGSEVETPMIMAGGSVSIPS